MVDAGPEIGGRFRLTYVIGSGSTGTVWAAEDVVSGEAAAIKILHAHLCSSATARRRVKREAALAQVLQHPNCVRVRSRGATADGRHYLIMERLTGRTLASLLREEGPLPAMRAIRIVAQILDAMVAAHRVGLIHRDLKPSNVMVIAERDLVKVCDFGLATLIDPHRDGHRSMSDSLISLGGEICGTPEYMAPEQACGELLDARTDLYSVAVILFHAVVGELPFKGDSPLAIVSQHLSAPRPRPSALRPRLEISPALDGLILRGMARDRRERPSSAEVFRADLLQVERDYALDAALPGRTSFLGDLPTLSATTRHRLSSVRTWSRPILMSSVAACILIFAVHLRLDRRARLNGARPLTPTTAAGVPNTFIRAPLPAQPVLPSPRTRLSARRSRPHTQPESVSSPAFASRDPGAAIENAEELLARGEIVAACRLGDFTVQRAPRLPSARAFLGRCYMRLGRLAEARASYREYLALQPSAADAPFVHAILGTDQP